MFDGKAWGAEIVAIVKGYVDGAAAPLLARIDELDARLAGMPKPSTPEEIITFVGAVMPQKAVEADPEILAGLVREQVRTAVAAIPVAKEVDLSVPEELCERVAFAVRMMAETPDIVAQPDQRGSAAAPVHVHMPEIIMPELKFPDAAIHVAAPVVNVAPAVVSVPAAEKRRTRTVVKAHDAAGRIAEFEQEEI